MPKLLPVNVRVVDRVTKEVHNGVVNEFTFTCPTLPEAVVKEVERAVVERAMAIGTIKVDKRNYGIRVNFNN